MLNDAFAAGQVGVKLAGSEHWHFVRNEEKYFGSRIQTVSNRKLLFVLVKGNYCIRARCRRSRYLTRSPANSAGSC